MNINNNKRDWTRVLWFLMDKKQRSFITILLKVSRIFVSILMIYKQLWYLYRYKIDYDIDIKFWVISINQKPSQISSNLFVHDLQVHLFKKKL